MGETHTRYFIPYAWYRSICNVCHALPIQCLKYKQDHIQRFCSLYRVIEKDGRDLKLLLLKKYWTDLHVWRLKMFRKV